MKPIDFKQANRTLSKPSNMTDDECNPLRVNSDGKVCISLWRMGWRERLSALFFGNVWVFVHSGWTQPPIALMARRGIFQEKKGTEYSIAHIMIGDMNMLGKELYPDGFVPWSDELPPKLTGKPGERRTGNLRSCEYCGSMHPHDVAEAIRAGARGEWADMKYGWPHKAYFENIPNPFAGMMEARASGNSKPSGKYGEGWIQISENEWRESGSPAPEKTYGKFYAVHLLDASEEDRITIEEHLGLTFVFHHNGKVEWRPVEKK